MPVPYTPPHRQDKFGTEKGLSMRKGMPEPTGNEGIEGILWMLRCEAPEHRVHLR